MISSVDRLYHPLLILYTHYYYERIIEPSRGAEVVETCAVCYCCSHTELYNTTISHIPTTFIVLVHSIVLYRIVAECVIFVYFLN